MSALRIMENEILKHLYELGILGFHGGWERESNFDRKAIDELYRVKLLDKSIPSGFIRLSELGVGAVIFGYQNADKIFELV